MLAKNRTGKKHQSNKINKQKQRCLPLLLFINFSRITGGTIEVYGYIEGCGDICQHIRNNESTVQCELEGAGVSLELTIWKNVARLTCADTDLLTLDITRKEEFFNVTIAVYQLAFKLSM